MDDFLCEPIREGAKMALGRILTREIFLYLLDLEVKRSRRYQNFFSIFILKLVQLSNRDNGRGLPTCYGQLSRLLQEEFRESDILASTGENTLAVLLPYADVSASGKARAHFEASLDYYDFKKQGYEVRIDQISFPGDGTDTGGLTRKVIGPEAN